MKKILLLGSGELGKEFVIACQRLGQYVIAVDSYDNAPAMQVAQKREVINMLDGDQLDALVEKYKPDLIFLSNSDSERDYRVCKQIRSESTLKNTPIKLAGEEIEKLRDEESFKLLTEEE